MRLERLDFENFRAYTDGELLLPDRGLLRIAGANNSGKTALLSVLDVARGAPLAGSALRHASGVASPAVVRATFALSDDDRAALSTVAARETWFRRGAFNTLVFEFRDLDGERMYLASVLTELDNAPWTLGVALRDGGLDTLETVVFPADAQADTPPPELRPAGGGIAEFLPLNAPNLFDIGKLWTAWRSSTFHYDGLREHPRERFREMGTAASLQPSGANLAEVLLGLMSADDARFRAIRAVVADLVPDLGELIAPASDEGVAVAFNEAQTSARRNLLDVGAGVGQVLLAATACLTQAPGSIVVLEEPEANLHPGAQRRLLRHLESWADERLVVISTHSTVFLEGAEPGEVLLVARERGASHITRVREEYSSLLEALGVRLAPTLTGSIVVLVEGVSDEAIIDVWFGDKLAAVGGSVAHLNGADVTHQLDRIRRLILDAHDQLGKRVLFVRDRDELSAGQVAALEKEGDVFVLAVREIENLFLPETMALESVLAKAAAAAGFTGDLPSGMEIETTVRRAADELRNQVLVKRVAARLERPLTREMVNELVQSGLLTLEACVEAVHSRALGSASQEDALRQVWEEERSELESVWDSDWQALAPGEEVLDALWRTVGARYKKRRDGPRIAQAVVSPPAALARRIDAFLAQSS